MKTSDKTNPALLIDPNASYEVDYTIDQSGKKHVYPQVIKGGDMTEKQIIDYVDKVSLSDLVTGL